MKMYLKFIYLFFVVIVIHGCKSSPKQNCTQNLEDTVRSSIGFSKKVIDFGTLSNDTIVTAFFFIKNIGFPTLIIKEVEPECSCTGFTLDKDTVLAGDSTRLLINFNTRDKGLGLQKKVISIRSNSVKEYNSLFIKCNIR